MPSRPLLPVWLNNKRIWFPDPMLSDAEGLVAAGGDFSIPRLLLAYRSGIFPWTADPITWWSPDPRGVIELDQLHVPRSLAKFMRRNPFEITRDRAFAAVMDGCSMREEETWITPEFKSAYLALHQAGHAHSLECWQDGKLVGGIYGVTVGGLFAGESMFHCADNASKVALCMLVGHLRERGFGLLDVQMLTPVTTQMGGSLMPRKKYLERLKTIVELPRAF